MRTKFGNPVIQVNWFDRTPRQSFNAAETIDTAYNKCLPVLLKLVTKMANNREEEIAAHNKIKSLSKMDALQMTIDAARIIN